MPPRGPTELLFHDPAKAFDGHPLFDMGGRTWLIDLKRPVVHTRPIGTAPHLPDDGHILDASKDDPGGLSGFEEIDWRGRTVWEWRLFDHVVQDLDPAKPNHVGQGRTVADHPGRINLNMPGKPLGRD